MFTSSNVCKIYVKMKVLRSSWRQLVDRGIFKVIWDLFLKFQKKMKIGESLEFIFFNLIDPTIVT